MTRKSVNRLVRDHSMREGGGEHPAHGTVEMVLRCPKCAREFWEHQERLNTTSRADTHHV